tara:strand:+ start:400 stop:591 length:192 start_codon:yes stop_codon:yes gene_type:complete
MVLSDASPANKGQGVVVRVMPVGQVNTSVSVTTLVVGSPSSASDVKMSSKSPFRMNQLNFSLD